MPEPQQMDAPEAGAGPDEALEAFQRRIGHHFANASLLTTALTHPSWMQQHGGGMNNQRLEFLGDSVLSLTLARELFLRMPDVREGVLTHSRAALAKRALLSTLALELGIDAVLRLSEAEERNGGRSRESILEDTLEAVAGAVFLDSSFEHASQVVIGWYGDIRKRLEGLLGSHNPKGRLQELVQPAMGNEAISYTLLSEEGPAHMRVFRVRLDIGGEPKGEGSGSSKKEAEENAAREALTAMEARDAAAREATEPPATGGE
jgi:ribonuclease-3